MRSRSSPRSLGLAGLALSLAVGCRPAPNLPEGSGPFALSFVNHPSWDDGRAELSFYRSDAWGEEGATHTLETITVKQSYDPRRESKADGVGVDAFKWILRFQRGQGPERVQVAHVANLARPSLTLLKASHTQFDGCSNQYRELVRRGDRLGILVRSDDYGNRSSESEALDGYPAAALPLLIRALDFTRLSRAELLLLAEDGAWTRATVLPSARVQVPLGDRSIEVDEVRVTFDPPFQLPWGDAPTGAEVYWVGDGPERPLYGFRDAGGGYRVTRTRTVRAAYWAEPLPASDASEPRAE